MHLSASYPAPDVGTLESSQLLASEDWLNMYTLRANYQAALWRRSLQCEPTTTSPTDHGWTVDDDDTLAIVWMRGSPAPDVVLQLLSCHCTL